MEMMVNKNKLKIIKKGYSLVELLVIIGILFIIVGGCSLNLYKFHRQWSNNTNVDFCDNYILHVLQNSALYCKQQNVSGRLEFCDKNKIKFYINEELIRVYEIPKEFKFMSSGVFNNNVKINNFGTIITACTISYEDANKDVHDITIRVGSHYVKVKEYIKKNKRRH
ncbi:hypothetical protein [Clostridium novyi]|uniref:Prepilin peptidase, putative n=1 Tax=Clostridium novyi (strain NT) TaxID=386415 RepID=A0Q080_CLONN|nr:hypothetical protein [Clostridium novyi]ABK62040.1 prepilin peptidase, putative [Clostridium novyi NT]